jgi:hypothetical protein
MSLRLLALTVLAVCAFVTSASRAVSDDAPPTAEDMMKLMQKYAAQGQHHAELGTLIGKWDLTFRMPGMPGEPSKGTAETKWWIQDRFIETRMNVPKAMFGKDVELVSLTGWDNYKHKWVGTTASSMGTSLVSCEGVVVDPTGKVRVMYGALDEYLTGEHDKTVKYVTRIQSPDAHVIEVWDMAIGETGQVVMEFSFSRHK